MTDTVAQLYEASEQLKAVLAKKDADSAAPEYEKFIAATTATSTDPAKQLAADILPLYFHYFPTLQERALNAVLDLIEDRSLMIRVRAIKALETLGKQTPSLIPRLSDVLAQLLLSDDSHEQTIVRSVFAALFSLNSHACLVALMNQVREGDAKLRERILDFFDAQTKKHKREIGAFTDQQQGELATAVKSIFTNSDLALELKDFKKLINFLLSLKVVKSDSNIKTDLAAIISNYSKIEGGKEAVDSASVTNFINGVKLLSTYKKYNMDAAPFLAHFTDVVLPSIAALDFAQQRDVLRSAASLIGSISDSKTAKAVIEGLWTVVAQSVAAIEQDSRTEKMQLLEIIFILFHTLFAKFPELAESVLGLTTLTGQPRAPSAVSKYNDTITALTALASAINDANTQAATALAAKQLSLRELPKTAETSKEQRKALLNESRDLKTSVKVNNSVLALVTPLTAKVPKFIAVPEMSWRKEREAGGGDNGNGKGKDVKGKKGEKVTNGKEKGKKQQSQPQPQPTKSNKRKNQDSQQSQQQQQPAAKKRKSEGKQQPQQPEQPSQQLSRKQRKQQSQQSVVPNLAAGAFNPLLLQQAALWQYQQQAAAAAAQLYGQQFLSQQQQQHQQHQGQGQGKQSKAQGQAQRQNRGKKRGRQ